MSQATVTATPATPASAYRPLKYTVQGAGLAALSAVSAIRPATSTDVTDIGGDLAEGDILVRHATIIGDLEPEVGGMVFITGNAYAGLWVVAKVPPPGPGGLFNLVITAPDLGTVTSTGSIGVWPDGYTVWCEVGIYTDPDGSPTKVRLQGTPELDGSVDFHVDKVIRDYFSSDISAFVLPIDGGGLVQNAHGVTALFYKCRFVEGWNDTTTPVDPWDGTHEIDEDEDFRIAVNGVHPYSDSVLSWPTAGMSAFLLDLAQTQRKFLTMKTRETVLGGNAGIKLTLRSDERFRVAMLTNGSTASRLRVLNGDTGTTIGFVNTTSPSGAAVIYGVGPADLAGDFTLPSKYVVQLVTPSLDQLSERIEVTVDDTCAETSHQFGWLNPLGGIDCHMFTGREFTTEGANRFSVTKEYSAGTGFDWRERTYRNQPVLVHRQSSRLLDNDTRKWLGQSLMRSPNVVRAMSDTQAATVVITTASMGTGSSRPEFRPITFEYRLGVDNLAQQA